MAKFMIRWARAKTICTKRVTFIGSADERIREDYLRILRFFRFSAIYADQTKDLIQKRFGYREPFGRFGQIIKRADWRRDAQIIICTRPSARHRGNAFIWGVNACFRGG